ncbi:uncharacterized protein L201_000134 [Kwoniella dendrophila CBS 6074]|uniref:Pinin/SDK/MemA protein domain-containing protein n=1 Tax=Kwoniella dendrophila CBS 6074 TaxID=1295534 RepID=A0AAX4JKE6_9TREE
MPSSALPSYYIPPPHITSSSQSSRSTSSTLPKRPSIFDNVVVDLLSAIGNTTTHTETASFRSRSSGNPPKVPPKMALLGVDGELHKLKHSISERNLIDSRRSTKDLKAIDRLMENHRKELKEIQKIKKELEEERRTRQRLEIEKEEMRSKYENRLEETQKANKKALKILMNLQKQEFLKWSKDLRGHLPEIEVGIKKRINNWEKSARSNDNPHKEHKGETRRYTTPQQGIQVQEEDKHVEMIERSSSPESDTATTQKLQKPLRRKPSKNGREKGARFNRMSPIIEKHPYAR